MKFYFVKGNTFRKWFYKKRQVKVILDPKLCQSLYFICHVIFDQHSELRQISCIIPHLVEIQDSLYRRKFSINRHKNLYN